MHRRTRFRVYLKCCFLDNDNIHMNANGNQRDRGRYIHLITEVIEKAITYHYISFEYYNFFLHVFKDLIRI